MLRGGIGTKLQADSERISKIKKAMEENEIQLLAVKNPENVLYLTGYWPLTGPSLAIFPLDGDPTLILPSTEVEFTDRCWVKDKRTYEPQTLQRVESPRFHIKRILQDIEALNLTVGYEKSFETLASSHLSMEVNCASFPTLDVLREAWETCTFVDATNLLHELRKVKTEMETERLKLANEIAEIGLEAARQVVEEETSETEVAMEAEKSIHEVGTGYKNEVRLVRGFAFVMSGPQAAKANRPYNVSSNRTLRRGDLVLIELNVCADGYWSDLTRTWTVGKPDKKQKEIWETLLKARELAIGSIKEGVPVADVDKVARKHIKSEGYEKNFTHGLGHGIGLRLHEPPTLHPVSEDVLQPNTIHSIEPGIYIPNYGGARIEDNFLDLEDGGKSLSTYSRVLEA